VSIFGFDPYTQKPKKELIEVVVDEPILQLDFMS